MRAANSLLEEHQKVRAVSVWPGDSLPRTEGTGKLKRAEVQRWVSSGAAPPAPEQATLESIVSRFAQNRAVGPATTLDELGLSSLERVELMMAIEQGFGQAPVFNREGGSIPVVSTLQQELGVPSVLFGVGLPDENAHAPDEKLDLGNFHNGIIASAYLYREIAAIE